MICIQTGRSEVVLSQVWEKLGYNTEVLIVTNIHNLDLFILNIKSYNKGITKSRSRSVVVCDLGLVQCGLLYKEM